MVQAVTYPTLKQENRSSHQHGQANIYQRITYDFLMFKEVYKSRRFTELQSSIEDLIRQLHSML